MSAAIPPRTTTVETVAIVKPRRSCRRFAASRSARRSLMWLLEDGGVGLLGDPGLLDVAELARVVQGCDRGRDTVGERRVLLEERAPRIAARSVELPDRGRIGHLHGGEVEGGRDIHDHSVHLAVLQRADDVV